VYQQVIDALAQHSVIEFAGIEPNPKYDNLMQAVALAKKENVDYVLAVGGGSIVDASKFIVAAACYTGDDPWDILQRKTPVEKALPLGCVLTLPATGSESNAGAVVTRDDNKLTFSSPLVRPLFAVLDPATTLSLSDRQISNGVVDAFVHTMEQYLTYPVNGKVQDRFAEGLLQTLIEEGPYILQDKTNMDHRSNVMWAATLALNGLIGAGVPQDWSTHMIAHELTGLYGIDHARTLSIILPANLAVRQESKKQKLLQYAERVWHISEGTDEQKIQMAIAKTRGFFKKLGMPVCFADADLDSSHIPQILQKLEAHGMTALGERREVTLEISQQILEKACS
jgi:NADP-dependent alcohol dehydrogenase